MIIDAHRAHHRAYHTIRMVDQVSILHNKASEPMDSEVNMLVFQLFMCVSLLAISIAIYHFLNL